MESFSNYKENLRLGFPSDDACSLQQLASGSTTLDLWADWQFVQNEIHHTSNPYGFFLERTPVGAGTITGTVYHQNHPIQTFVFTQSGQCVLQRLETPKHVHPARIVNGSINLKTGEIKFSWYGKPQKAYFVVSYEYSLECQP